MTEPVVLGIDTATGRSDVAVLGRDGELVSFQFGASNNRSNDVLSVASKALDDAGISKNELSLVACAAGPGSFTGLRTGFGMVAGLADALNIEAIGVPTLDAMAFAANALAEKDKLLVATLKARVNEVYASIYRPAENGGSPEKLSEDISVTPADLALMIKHDALFIGDGYEENKDILKSKGVEIKAFGKTPEYSCAYGIAMMARKVYKKGRGNDFPAAPRYVRRSQAEINWELKNS